MQSAWAAETPLIESTHLHKAPAHWSINKAITINFDFLTSQQSELIPEDTQGFQEDLYSVEKDQLLPITSPFLVPGIYKKIGLAAAECHPLPADSTGEPRNVFITEQERRGRIISSSEFDNLYIKEQETETPTTQKKTAPKVVLKKEPSDLAPAGVDNFDALSKIAQDILQFCSRDHIVIDRKRNEVVRTDCSTNQKTIYRFVSPESLKLTAKKEQKATPEILKSKHTNRAPIKLKLKLGRPRKKPAEQDSAEGVPAQATLKRKIERKNVMENSETATAESLKQTQLRTRSGRVVKLVKPALISETPSSAVAPLPQDSAETLRSFLAELRDSDYHCSNKSTVSAVPLEQTPTKPDVHHNPPAKRRVPPESICPTCHKIFLGRRLQRHFTQHPDHMQARVASSEVPAPTPTLNGNLHNSHDVANNALEQLSLFRFLIAKLQKSHLNEDQRAELFLSEINDLVEQLQLRSSRIIRNTSGLHLVTARSARVLGIPEGQYALDMSAIEAPPELDTSCLLNFEHMNGNALPAPSLNSRCLDYSMSLDDEAVQKLNLSAGGKLLPPSEESLLRAVDVDFVPAGMQKLNETNLLHAVTQNSAGEVTTLYDQASDNAVEAVSMKETTVQQTTPILDLAVDFFQFNN